MCNLTQKVLCQRKGCKLCFDRSFASSDKAIYWSDKNVCKPREVCKSSNKKFWFKCHCKHEFEAILGNVKKGKFCPYCANQKLCNDDDCLVCRSKSFASHPMAQYWLYEKNDKKPREVFKTTHTKYWFKCTHGHKFKAQLANVTNGCWCPKCYCKTEAKLSVWLEANHHSITSEVKFPWCMNIRPLPFDFLINELNVIIELDGRQHFKQIMNWITPEENHSNDIFKTSKALENGFSVIRILQTDVYYDRNDWEIKLKKCLRTYSKPTCIFITNKNEYDKLEDELKEMRDTGVLDCKVKCR